VVGYAELNKTE